MVLLKRMDVFKEKDRLPGPKEIIENRYLINRILGDGGYGTVLEATDVETNRRLAIKTEKYSKSMIHVEVQVLRAAKNNGCKHFPHIFDQVNFIFNLIPNVVINQEWFCRELLIRSMFLLSCPFLERISTDSRTNRDLEGSLQLLLSESGFRLLKLFLNYIRSGLSQEM